MVKVYRKSRLSQVKQEELLKYLVVGSTAVLVGVNRHTATLYFHKLREVIAAHLEQDNHGIISGKIELIDKLFWRASQRQERPRSGW